MKDKVFIYIYQTNGRLPGASEFLDAEELAYISGLKSEKRRREFLHSRFLIKTVLKEHHQIAFPKIRKSKNGKPFVKGIKFNISHSKNQVVLAVCENAEVGVDIEISKKHKKLKEIAQRYFSSVEFDYITSPRTSREQESRFLNLWSLKEAYIKAIGGSMVKKASHVFVNIKEGKIEKVPSKKPVSLFLNDRANLALCVARNTQARDVLTYEAVLGRFFSLRIRKTKHRYKSLTL